MKFTLKQILFGLVGLVSTVLSIVCFALDTGSWESSKSYGGDAYTGIQNAAAQTANNVQDAAAIMKFGFGSVLLIAGLTLILFAVFMNDKPAAAPALQQLTNDPLYGPAAKAALTNPPAPASAPAPAPASAPYVPPYAPPAQAPDAPEDAQ